MKRPKQIDLERRTTRAANFGAKQLAKAKELSAQERAHLELAIALLKAAPRMLMAVIEAEQRLEQFTANNGQLQSILRAAIEELDQNG